VGPYTGVNCALTFLSSSVRVKSDLSDSAYGRDLSNADDRFIDYYGCVDMIVTSGGINDSGMFDGDQYADLLRPFENQGAVATVRLSLPSPDVQPFDYATISDVIVHVQYTARAGGDDLAARALKELKDQLADASNAGLALLFSLRYDFPTEWAASGQG